MAHTLRKWLASSWRSQRLFLVGLLIVLSSSTLTTAAVIYQDEFDGLLSPLWFDDWGQWASQGYDGTNDPAPPPVMTPTTPGSSSVGCDVNNPFDDCGPHDPPTLAAQNIPLPRPVDTPGNITTGVAGFTTLRADPINPNDPPGCDPDLDECGPCDPATQDCFERADGTISVTDVNIDNTTTTGPIINDVNQAGVHMGLVSRYVGGGGANPVQHYIAGQYRTANLGGPAVIAFMEFKYSDQGERVSEVTLPNQLESPLHMSLTLEGDDASFTIGDADEEYTITMVNGTHVHNTGIIPVDHTRLIPDPGRWGFWSFAAINTGTDYQYWDNFCFTDPGETCGVVSQPGDHDLDGDVDGNDFLWHQISDPGAINTDWGPNYGVVALSGVEAVPEPSVLSLCALAAFALWPTRRQRV